ncbi:MULTISPECIES: acyltransferase family protein [unclassified Pseudomonas]|uniref:acyltransferase family protein n=1 Tax=unclassified Pseudomonas TaxID=196821 RepID=UPI0025CF7D61|nr:MULTISPECIES: acyltransferase [unclassified Pseudomonas]
MTVKMSPAFSIYLDLVRLASAGVVLLSHYPTTVSQAAITNRFNFAYDAVIVFFVLSGYVISYAVDTKEDNGVVYSVNRIARILPVAAVAVVLSLLLMMWGSQTSPAMYPDVSQLQLPFYYVARTLSFTNEFWWDDIRPFMNGPYWSLAFEVWCYVIYGLVVFTRGPWRVAFVSLALLVTGPKQWLMLPIWFAGVAAYRYRDRFSPSRGLLWLLCLGPVALFAGIQLNNPRDWSYPLVGMQIERVLGHGLDSAANFGWGYVLAALMSVHLIAVRQLCRTTTLDTEGRAGTLVRQLASYTFSLYILHYPLTLFWRAQLEPAQESWDPALRALIYAGILIPVFVLGQLVERRRKAFRQAVRRVLTLAQRLTAPRAQ